MGQVKNEELKNRMTVKFKKHKTTIMKANFFKIFIVAAVLPIASSLISCSEDVADNNRGESLNSTTTSFFSTDDDMTRTSINNKRAFFWEDGDKIFVKKSGEWIESSPVSLTEKASSAKFVISGSFTDTNYPVAYTGTNAASAAEVTIADQQTQKAWNDGSHLGSSGDCGVANAIRLENGKYKFTLDHKASYLLIYPYLHADLMGSYKLQKIEIYSDLSHSNIAGTYNFSESGALTLQTGTGKQEITLNCANRHPEEFDLPATMPDLSSANVTAPHCFVVIAPGHHQLTIKYWVEKSDGTVLDFIKDIALKDYVQNGVYTFVHELHYAEVDYGFEFNEVNTIYRWGRTYEFFGTNNSDYDTRTTIVTDGFWSTMPTSAAITWYMKADIYYDNAIDWKYNRRNGTQETRRGGWWLKKKAYIPGFSSTTASGIQSTIPIKGRPDATIENEYFFLPKLPSWGVNETEWIYWTASPISASIAQRVNFNQETIIMGFASKINAYVAGLRPDGTPWFQ